MICEGQVAYGAYCAFKMDADKSLTLPTWLRLSWEEKQAWQHAASEAISVHVAAVLA
jgi:hypothetical protein